VFLDFYVEALSNLGFTICGSYIEQVWPPLKYRLRPTYVDATVNIHNPLTALLCFGTPPQNRLFHLRN